MHPVVGLAGSCTLCWCPLTPPAVPLPLAPRALVSRAVLQTLVPGPPRGAADPRALPQLYSSWHSLNKVWTDRYARLEEQLQASVSYQETMQVGCWGSAQADTPHTGLPRYLCHPPIPAQGSEGPLGHSGWSLGTAKGGTRQWGWLGSRAVQEYRDVGLAGLQGHEAAALVWGAGWPGWALGLVGL